MRLLAICLSYYSKWRRKCLAASTVSTYHANLAGSSKYKIVRGMVINKLTYKHSSYQMDSDKSSSKALLIQDMYEVQYTNQFAIVPVSCSVPVCLSYIAIYTFWNISSWCNMEGVNWSRSTLEKPSMKKGNTCPTSTPSTQSLPVVVCSRVEWCSLLERTLWWLLDLFCG